MTMNDGELQSEPPKEQHCSFNTSISHAINNNFTREIQLINERWLAPDHHHHHRHATSINQWSFFHKVLFFIKYEMILLATRLWFMVDLGAAGIILPN
jgi:hypothetical protein